MVLAWSGRLLMAAGLVCCLVGTSARAAEDYVDNPPPLSERATPEIRAALFPDAERIELMTDDGPAALGVYEGDALVGFVFSTLDVVRARGYTTTPFDIIAGVDLDGQITGAVNVFHREPHIINDETRTEKMVTYLNEMAGVGLRSGSPEGPPPKFVAGATVSARAMRNAIRDSARLVLRARGLGPIVTEPTLDMDFFHAATLADLVADGSLSHLTVTNAQLEATLAAADAEGLTLEVPTRGGPDDVYLDLTVGLATPAMIGRNTAGESLYTRLTGRNPGSQAIFLSSNSRYDFQGFKYHNASNDYRLERLRIIQGETTYTFDRDTYIRGGIGRVSGIVVLSPDSGFDPLAPWRAEVLVYGTDRSGETQSVVLPAVNYQLPASLILLPEPEPLPAWMEAWQEQRTNEIILGVALVVLTLILAFQSVLTRNRQVHRWVRNGFLLFTLGWLGWTASAQLSIVHVLNYLQAPFAGVDIGFYLTEPLIVMLSLYTGASLILLGRGVFCGWLCPFGALQEMLAHIARFLRLPQWTPSEGVQRKLWWGKYASLGALVALAFLVPTAASVAEEVEPFKTAITSVFARTWPYAIYAGALLSIGLFAERAYCRFLCPLGGALAILDRLHLLNLLKRRPECGSPCRLCERSCPVRAIETSGKIKMAECFQCLDCQVDYYDDHRCPPLVAQRKRQTRTTRPAPVVKPVAAPVPVPAGVMFDAEPKGSLA